MKSHINILFTYFLFLTLQPRMSSTRHTDIVLLGSTGDLAQKYLWQSFFNLYIKYQSTDQSFMFHACGRSSTEMAGQKLESIFDRSVVCNEKTVEKCSNFKNNFRNLVYYLQLKSEADFKKLGKILSHGKEKHRDIIFYLSIPPEAYSFTAENIRKFCHPKDEDVKFRIVFEKPFGHDLSSARKLVDEMSGYFEEKEIFRIDHYLGKSIVRQILPFRMANPQVEKLLNRDHVERVEIVLKEIVDSKGRITYYNQNGVIRDILQNHLMEVLILIAVDVSPKNKNTEISQLKLKLLNEVEVVRASSLLIGQYSDYLNQSAVEMPEFRLAEYVPTFAAALLSIRSARWMDVPFVLVSGKAMAERTSYVRVVFKRNTFCVSKCSDVEDKSQIIFHIGNGNLESPMILISKNFKDIKFPTILSETFNTIPSDLVYGTEFAKFHSLTLHNDIDAYTTLLDDIFKDNKENFVGSDHLQVLWKIWDKVLKTTKTQMPRIYQRKDLDNELNFQILGSKLSFMKNKYKPTENKRPDQTPDFYTPAEFLGNKLVCSSEDQLYGLLAGNIVKSVKEGLRESEYFHIAFSGGSTPIKLFQTLAEVHSDLPWDFIHVWQVDERCVSSRDDESNFKHLWENLLQYVSIPYENIHPMPVHINGKLCVGEDNSRSLYEESIRYFIPSFKFDYIVLGLGSDGHTASLFPGSSDLDAKNMVALTTKDIDSSILRMTLTYLTINHARHISILIVGSEKQDIIKSLENSRKTYRDFPVLGVKPHNGHMTWFIDNKAFFDNHGD